MKSKLNKKKIISILGCIFVFIFVVEIFLQITNIPNIPAKPDPFVGLDGDISLFQETKDSDGKSIYLTKSEKLAYFNQVEFSKEKSRDIFRVFCFGGAATQGFPYGGLSAFPKWVRAGMGA